MKTARRKTSLEVDFDKVEQAKALLGTTTLTSTIDAALDEIIAHERRQTLIQLLFDADELDLHRDDIMRDAWR